jgi:Zn-dependent metalloprotease
LAISQLTHDPGAGKMAALRLDRHRDDQRQTKTEGVTMQARRLTARRVASMMLAPALLATACNDGFDGSPDRHALDTSAAPVQGSLFAAADEAARSAAAELGMKHLFDNEAVYLAGVDAIWTTAVQIDELGMAHTRVMQTQGGVPVWGGEAIVHLTPAGQVAGVTDTLVQNVSVDTNPRLDAERALDLALIHFGDARRLTQEPEVELLVLRRDGNDHLAWRVQLARLDGGGQPSMPVYFIDAHSGDRILSFDNLKTASLSDADKRTHDMNNGTSYSASPIADSSDEVANDAHVHAGHTLDYFLSKHNRDSFDGDGTLVRSYVHYGNDFVNAFWNGSVLTYGDGDGVRSGPLVGLDVIAHEFTHGVTEHSANLIYEGQSGALNEASSDILAAAVEAHVEGINEGTYEVGEDFWLEAPALRFMYNPTQDGKSRDHFSTRYTGFEDNGGVHMNSGIANLYFYMLAEGGQHPNPAHRVAPVTAIGLQPAANIWYRALTQYMTSSTSFSGARTATINAATDLFGATSDQVCQVKNAWAEVGVGASCNAAPPPPPPPTPVLQNGVPVTGLGASTGTMLTFTMDVPAGASNLVFQISGGSGDADMYVRFGAPPTTSTYDCRPYRSGNNESCTFATPSAGTWHVGVRAFSTFSGVTLRGSFSGGGAGWSGSATPNLPLVDNGQACHTLAVAGTGNASDVKLDIAGTHAYRSILRGTLAHNGTTVAAFPTGTFGNGAGSFSFTGRAVAGLGGSASGDWTLCIVDTDAFGDTGTLTSWSVHN